MGLMGTAPVGAHGVALHSRRAIDLCRVRSCLCCG